MALTGTNSSALSQSLLSTAAPNAVSQPAMNCQIIQPLGESTITNMMQTELNGQMYWSEYEGPTRRKRTIRIDDFVEISREFSKGDMVIALRTVTPSTIQHLPFDKDDVILVEEPLADSTFIGALSTNSSRTGIVPMDCVKKLRQNSICNPSSNIERKESTVLPRRPNRESDILSNQQSFQEYVNTEIGSQSWFMGQMERSDAESKLKGTPNGTFLVRYSPNRGTYAISISYQDEVKHMAIEQNDGKQFYLDDGYNFDSIVELINYYRVHNLIEIFNTLNTTLKSAYRDCKIYKVIHDFEGSEAKFLTIRKGDLVTLVDTIGEERGWWKIMLNNKVGFAPLSYMEPLDD
ncbi:hypothetical protein WR25_20034 [Diploscapter pachys]|uniref:SH2 domain-containing protein n=1 Tax=Diploscapter pachys TaxID=2018661 RepID=A0A2A2JU46_9BILA|nr:hypothetical protein WR25_20034 [Diploscapter pachys]